MVRRPRRRSRPLLVELVGPAGAGKTTLASHLPVSAPGMYAGLALWGLPRSSLVASAVGLIPTALSVARDGGGPRGPELSQMIRVGALRAAARRARRRGERIILLDEGPVFGLTWLRVHYGDGGCPARASWWSRAVTHWSQRLDAVVRLDATDAVLAERIRARAKPHLVQHASDAEIRAFTARFRRASDRVLTDLVRAGNVRVLTLRTDEASPTETATGLQAALATAWA